MALQKLKKWYFTVLLFLVASMAQAQAPNCNAFFLQLPNNNNPDSIHFIYLGFPMTSYHWDFGDGTTATTAAPWHFFTAPGTYNVCLAVFDSTAGGTCTDTNCVTVNISGTGVNCNPRYLHFAAGNNQENVNFFYIGSAATAYAWDFGDGGTATTQNPAHLYGAPGTYTVCVTITDSTANGTCTGTFCDSVVVTNPPPTCNPRFFKFANNANPDSIRFFYFGSQATTYAWDFGDGTTSTLQNPTHTYSGAGNFIACVTITDSTSGGTCTGTWCDTVKIVIPPPVCTAHYVRNVVNGTDSIHFNYNGNNAATYAWDFGDGTTSTLQNPTHMFPSTGNYTVCVTITNTNAGGTCTDTYCTTFHVTIHPPVCNAHYIRSSFNDPDSIQFTYNGTAASTYAWDFGDGTTSTLVNPLHVFAQGGTYHVCVTITTTNGAGTCTDNYCRNINIPITPPTCTPHFAHFPTSNLDSVSFVYNGSSAATYAWNFGDAGTSTAQNPSHVYATYGTYNVCVTITKTTNGGTCSATWCDSVHILAAVPVCDAHFQHVSLNNPDSVQFFPLSTSAISYTWDFGDNTSSTSATPWHEYAGGGIYTVCLTVTDSTAGGTCSNTVCDTVNIPYPAPVCDGQFTYVVTNSPDSIEFTPVSTSAATYTWDFGDGGSSTQSLTPHTYATSGTYVVCLTVTNSTLGGTCSNTWCDTLHIVIPPPVCDATFGNYSQFNNPDSVHVYANVTTQQSYTWDFGDGTIVTSQSDDWHLYTAPGDYIACLTVTDSTKGGTCTATSCDTIHIPYPAPVCTPQFVHVNVNSLDSIQFFYTGSTAVTFAWDFGDNTTSTAQDPTHVYSAPGVYTACVTITDSTLGGSCTNTWCDTVSVFELPPVCDAQFSSFVSSNPDSIYFYPLSTAANTYTWDFGDGNTSTTPTVWHKYAVDGIYTVCLTVADSNSAGTCTATWCDTIHAGAAPVCDAHFASLASITNQDSITFTPVNTGAVSYVWDFGDGSANSTAVSPLHVFTALGSFTVCLTISDTSFGGSCSINWCDTIHITSLTGIATNGASNNVIRIYPNPINDQATVELSNISDKSNFNISDLEGRIVFRNENIHNGSFVINTKEINSGIYFYSVTDHEKVVSQGKIVIVH
jgi:PKD repeat protein